MWTNPLTYFGLTVLLWIVFAIIGFAIWNGAGASSEFSASEPERMTEAHLELEDVNDLDRNPPSTL
ncbi:MAG TPA: hypothetical protein V6D47_20365 [Oscillatoriaceae cyanobacterium]